MKRSEVHSPQVHDLLRINRHIPKLGMRGRTILGKTDNDRLPLGGGSPFSSCFWLIAIGVRGHSRSERWAAFCEKSLVRKIVRPEELLDRTSNDVRRMPALRTLQEMSERWAELALPWGPGGSVGFELASGRKATTEASDLDLIIRAQQRITVEEARFLLDRTLGLEAKVDVRVETPVCGFSLDEYVSAFSAKILLRYPDGVRLGEDPWQEEA